MGEKDRVICREQIQSIYYIYRQMMVNTGKQKVSGTLAGIDSGRRPA